MPARSHFFLNRFNAFSKDSSLFTMTSVIQESTPFEAKFETKVEWSPERKEQKATLLQYNTQIILRQVLGFGAIIPAAR
jgi:hypothetical protein